MTEETSNLTFLISGTSLVLGLVIFYVGRALWIARHEWPSCRTDTKVLYLLVAPPLTLAVDLLAFTDRLFWSEARTPPRNVRQGSVRQLRPKIAMRSDG